MNGVARLAIDTVAALAIGAAGVAWGVHVVDGRADVTDIEPGDRVEAAVEALRTDDVYVPPDGRGMLAEDAEQRLERVVADAAVPVHVVVWQASDQAGGEPYSFTLPEMIAEELASPGSTSSGRAPAAPTPTPLRAPGSTTAVRTSRRPGTPSCGSPSSSSSSTRTRSSSTTGPTTGAGLAAASQPG